MLKYASTHFALPTKINRLGQNENYVFLKKRSFFEMPTNVLLEAAQRKSLRFMNGASLYLRK